MSTESLLIENPFTTDFPAPGEKVPGSPGVTGEELYDEGQTTAAVVADAKETVRSGNYNPAGRVRGQAGSGPNRYAVARRNAGAGSLIKDHPLTMTALAIGGGLVVATLLARKQFRNIGQGHGALDAIKYGLIGLAAKKVTGAIEHFIPGFNHQL